MMSNDKMKSDAAKIDAFVEKIFEEISRINNKVDKITLQANCSNVSHNYLLNIPNEQSNIVTKSHHHIDDLLTLTGEEFIEKVYLTLLLRKPDSSGKINFLSKLLNGELSKIEIIGRIRYSAEGRSKKVYIEGLRLKYVSKIFERLPVISHFISLINLSKLAKKIQIIEEEFKRGLSLTTKKIELIESHQKSSTLNSESLFKLVNETDLLSSSIANLKSSNKIFVDRLTSMNSNMNALEEHLSTGFDKLEAKIQHLEKNKSDSINDHNDFYFSLENKLRGPEKVISVRLQVYLPIVENMEKNIKNLNVIDLGCGRGEWLSLLNENKVKGKGVDINPHMIMHCQQLDLDVTLEDNLLYLQKTESNSIHLITAFHLVEHLELDYLYRLCKEIVRVLHPNGIVIIETPNPENLKVGSCQFYCDPTHLNPIPPQLLQLFLEETGLKNVKIMRLNECRDNNALTLLPNNSEIDSKVNEIAKVLNNNLFAPLDYAAIACK